MKTLKSLTKLPHSYTLFIPSTSEVNKDGSSLQQTVFTSLAKELSSRYGGTTRSAPSDGLWMSESEGLVSDNVWPLTTRLFTLFKGFNRSLFINFTEADQHLSTHDPLLTLQIPRS